MYNIVKCLHNNIRSFYCKLSAYSEEKETLTESEKVIEYTEENASSLVNQRDSFLEPQKSIDNNYEQEGTQIAPSDNDIRVIPDRYNTGCKGDLYRINGDKTINGVSIVYSGGNLVFDFYYRNTNISGTVVIENCDFSDYSVVIYHESAIKGRKIKLVFKNCNFSGFRNGRPESDVFSYEFYDCSFVGFNGSNAIFCNCRFGGSYNDGIVPFSNITVKDSYFLDFAPTESLTNGLHSDGTQMYGYSDSKVQNIIFSNCRFEVPAVLNTGCTSRVNACIMLQLEFNDGDNIKIEDCIINGGGYSIYAWSKNDNYKLTNVIFKNIKIGDAKLYGDIYPRVGDNVEFTDVVNQDLLYVSSVWNDGEYTHVIVSNDTNTDRIIRVVTGAGSYDYVIKRCLGGDELRYDNFNKDFEEFPFDIDIQIKADADYVICFDVTNGYENQIRYVSFDGNPTYYNSNNIVDMASTELLPDEEIKTAIIEGKCGENISYYLDKDGSLIIDGIGEMNNYHSQIQRPGWNTLR